jgi:hypothetical protein
VENAQPENAVKQDYQGHGEGGRPPQRMPQILSQEKSGQEETNSQEKRT